MVGATIKDVAREAGVCPSTVSRALAGSGAISEETKERVAAAARKLGYTPNTAARSLRSASSGMIGIVVPDISGEFYAACASAVYHTAREYGYAVLVADTEKRAGLGADCVKALLERRADGIIFIGGVSGDMVADTAAKGIPVVTGDSRTDGVPSVTFNNRETVAGLVKALYSDGCRSFTYVGEPTEMQVNLRDRLEGYRDGIRACPEASGREIIDERFDGDKLKAGFEIYGEYFADKTGHETIITANDLIAQGIISAANKAGRSVPGDIAAAGFDDSRTSAYWTPPLTTVRQDAAALAEECFKKLYAMIKKREVKNTVLRQEVIVRGSMLISDESRRRYLGE